MACSQQRLGSRPTAGAVDDLRSGLSWLGIVRALQNAS